jgi:hypothetical protein
MKQLLFAFAIQATFSVAFAIDVTPLQKPHQTPDGAKVVDLRLDPHYLYLKTGTNEHGSDNDFVRIDKAALLEGRAEFETTTSNIWNSIQASRSNLKVVEDNRRPDENTWLFGKQKIEIGRAYCAENLRKSHSLRIDGKKVATGIPNCMALLEPVLFDGKLWFGTTYPGEYGDSPGVGILLIDVTSRRRLAPIRKDLIDGQSGIMRVDPDLQGVWAVNDHAVHFFDRALKRRALAFYSEQFDPAHDNWSTIQISIDRKMHNPFAVAARIVMARDRDTQDVERASRQSFGRWRSMVGIGAYEKAVAELPQHIRSNFWIQYDPLERRPVPYWGNSLMTYKNGGREFRRASRLLSCIYESAGYPDWGVQSLILNIVVAAENMKNTSDAQLYQPNCEKQAAVP